MGRRVFTAILPGVSLPPYLSTISTAAVVSSASFTQEQQLKNRGFVHLQPLYAVAIHTWRLTRENEAEDTTAAVLMVDKYESSSESSSV